jgi:hypothetical protein
MAKERAWPLWLAAFGAAGSWTAAFLIVNAAGSATCIAFGDRVPRFGGGWWALVLVTVACAAAGIYALVVSIAVLRRTSTMPEQHRTAFMSLGGLLLNLLFLIGFVFDAMALLLAPVCG